MKEEDRECPKVLFIANIVGLKIGTKFVEMDPILLSFLKMLFFYLFPTAQPECPMNWFLPICPLKVIEPKQHQ